MKKNIPFRRGYWAKQAILAQSACNPSGLLHSATDCLSQWRESIDGQGDFTGSKCAPLHLILFHASFLVGMHSGFAYAGRNYPGIGDVDTYSKDYQEMTRLSEAIDLDSEAVEHFIAKCDVAKAITYKDASLTQEQERIFRQWARDHYNPHEDIQMDNYHPVVQDECRCMKQEWREGGGKDMEC